MLIYTMITLAISILFVWFGIRINRGALYLIHDYHQKNVKEDEKTAYGKALSKGMFGMAASMIVSGVVALFGESKSFMIASLVVLFLGFAISIAVLLRVQKKYNGGVFS
ncbi:MAG: hypothetical protein J6B67_03755 [Oscillospiraceae bacterium]|nr:hypothetical protein [Oscillospiraceae bacterium]